MMLGDFSAAFISILDSDRIRTMATEVPASVPYVKNGRQGRWWAAALERGQIHLGWKSIPSKLLRKRDLKKIKKLIGTGPGATQDFNALRDLLVRPSKRTWITFQDGLESQGLTGTGRNRNQR